MIPRAPPAAAPADSSALNALSPTDDSESGEDGADDSGDTVKPPTGSSGTSQALEELRFRYCEEEHAVDIDEPDRLDAQGRKGKPSLVATLADEVGLVRHLAPAREYFKKVANHYVFAVGLIGQFESVLERLAELFEFAYVRLAIPETQRPFAADFHLDLLDLVNRQFVYGAIIRAHNHVTHWIDYAAAWIEHLIGLRDAGDSFPLPPEGATDAAVDLRGFYNDFAERTFRASQNAVLPPPETPARKDASAATWKAKDTVAMSKMRTPMPNAFESSRDRRATYAIHPSDFSIPAADSWIDGLGTPRYARAKAAPRAVDASRAPERIGARAAFAAERPPHFDKTAMFKGEMTTAASTLIHSGLPSRAASRSHSRQPSPRGRTAQSPNMFHAPRAPDGGPPDDDDGDDDDEGEGRPPPRDRDAGDRRGQGRQPGFDPAGGAPGGGDPYGADDALDNGQNAGGGGASRGPTFDMRFKMNIIPAWDGSDSTAVEYFGKLAGLCRVGGEIPDLLPSLAPNYFTGRAEIWWRNLSQGKRVAFQRDFFSFVYGIREYLLSDRWTDRLREAYTNMRFRQRGFAEESPFDFVARRAYLCRFLFVLGPLELVDHVMANAPRAWHYIIGEHNVGDLDELMRRASTLHDELISAYQASFGLSESKIEEVVRRMLRNGVPRQPNNNPFRNQRTPGFAQSPPAPSAAVHFVDTDAYGLPESDASMTLDDYSLAAANLARDSPESTVAPAAHEAVTRSVYAFLANQSKQRPRPEKYLFPKSSHASPRPPPSPCKVCGGEKHWDRECPHWAAYETRRKQGALLVDTERPADEEDMYESVFSVYLNSMIAHLSSATENGPASAFFSVGNEAPEDRVEETPALARADGEVTDADGTPASPSEPLVRVPPLIPRPASVEDAEDEEERAMAGMPKALSGAVLEEASGADDWAFDLEPVVFTQALTAGLRGLPGPPEPDEVVRVPMRRKFKPGQSAKGISILSCRGRVNSRSNKGVTLRLDSGASISLIAKSYLSTLPHPPKVKKGLKVKIAQLTNNDPTIEGYVVMPVFIQSVNGVWLEFETELYVVPEMTVEVLLGEDWHVNFGLDVLRSLEGGTRVHVESVQQAFLATSRSADTTAAERKDVLVGRSYRVVLTGATSFVRAKSHRRARAARHRRKRALASGALRAYKDVLIPPESTCLVEVAGDLAAGKQWVIERNLVPCGADCYLTVPNALLSTESSVIPDVDGQPSFARMTRVPVANPTKLPRILRAGTVLAHAKNASEHLDKAGSAEEWEKMAAQASVLSAFAAELDPTASESFTASAKEDTRPSQEEPAELDPPAAAEAPDPTVYPSEDLEKIIDISPDVPAEVRAKALELFRKRIGAFGFDGRLGQLAVDAKIRTKVDTEPISEPLRGASPEKKKVIEEQLSKWFEMGVIEDSISPWAAPVVIVYRNGKARFCVDYRKLNAATIPDSFPIPRQSDILSALSGSQVLSSLDALAGFNQMGIAAEDVEKTAFRTHKGLYQFLRMPFGLRNGPAIFQRVMQSILSPFLWLFTLVYIDDIVVYSASYEDHLEHLDRVLGAIEKSGLTLSPNKCHFLYSSILLLGHKVSRLGLSTHKEKVEAIAALEPPRKLATLQTFLGMIVYFQAFIPYYSFIVAPLFKLLRKDTPWEWGAEQQYAFEQAKAALQQAPVLAHPMEGMPYRLYTDASDEALGACLQQVQTLAIRDLIGTPVYERLKRAYDAGEPVPQLCSKLSTRILDVREPGSWAPNFEDTTVQVERVVAYWSRTFKSAERNYSATEREALAARDALIKFQPFIEGLPIILVTDHGALQWARTFENTNRRLAAWGAVFGAYQGLEIVHRAGRLHSNVDPLSRLPRDWDTDRLRGPPEYIAPASDTTPSIRTNVDAAELLERLAGNTPAPKMTGALLATAFEQIAEPVNVLAVTRAQSRATKNSSSPGTAVQQPRNEGPVVPQPLPASVPTPITEVPLGASEPRLGPVVPQPLPASAPTPVTEVPLGASEPQLSYGSPGTRPDEPALKMRYEDKIDWKDDNPPPTLLISMSDGLKERYAAAYEQDPAFKGKGLDSDERSWYAGNRYYRGRDGLLFFRDADFMPRLCVPRAERPALLRRLHESASETAHAGAEKLYERLSRHYYWPRMRVDVNSFCATCDVCQKTKTENSKKIGLLQPHDIPKRPYERISLDLITGLPWSGLYNAILVIIDLLTKHAQFIPTDTGLNTEGFASLFIKHIALRYGLPSEIIADRDGRWLSSFFSELTRQMNVHMLLSSAHHPQHDGQTERTNRTLETMLRHYVHADHKDWDRWLPELEFAYNSTVHASTGLSPAAALRGYQPRSATDLLVPEADSSIPRHFTAHGGVDEFLLAMQNHRHAARDAIAAAQHRQAQAYNQHRRERTFQPDELVLIKPHSLELVESKGEGAKLVQRAFGPFAIQERVSDSTYRVDLPPEFPMSNVIHVSHLRPYQPSPVEWGERARIPVPRWNANAAEEYSVDKLVAHRRNRTKKQLQYLVRWEGFGPEHDSWLTAHQLRNAPARLLDYRRAHGL